MSKFRNFWWNLTHDSRDKELLIAELRRLLEAVQGRELELRRGEWVMRYFDMEADRDRWRNIALFNIEVQGYDNPAKHVQLCYRTDGTYHGGSE